MFVNNADLVETDAPSRSHGTSYMRLGPHRVAFIAPYPCKRLSVFNIMLPLETESRGLILKLLVIKSIKWNHI